MKTDRKRPGLRHLAETALFLTGLLLLLALASLLFRPKSCAPSSGMRDAQANGILAEEPGSVDLLILGDSNAYSSFIPSQLLEEFGIRAYVCSTPSQKLYYTAEFLGKALRSQRPKAVILETDALYRDFTYADALLSGPRQIFSVFEYHDRWKTLRPEDFALRASYNEKDKSKGYHPNADIAGTKYKASQKTDARTPIPPICRSYVERIRNRCEENGIPLILVCAPNLKSWKYARHNSTADLAAELSLEYIDMNLLREEVPIDWSNDTRDKGEHLNNFGRRQGHRLCRTVFAGKRHFSRRLRGRKMIGGPSFR